jgi:hypothetical protein
LTSFAISSTSNLNPPEGLTATLNEVNIIVGSNLAASTTYYYEVTGVTPTGETTVSNEASVTEGTQPYLINLSWTSDNASSYNIYKGTTSGGEKYLTTVSAASYCSSDGTCGYTDNGNTATTHTTPPSTNTASTVLPQNIEYAASVQYNGYIYEIGGYNSANTYPELNTVYYAPVLPGGDIGGWASTTALPSSVEGATSVVKDGYIYVMGGYSGSGIYIDNVYYAPINSNGTIGTWSTTSVLPQGIAFSSSAEYNGYIYEIGGYNGSNISDIYYSQIQSNGSLGAWINTGTIPAGSTDYLSSTIYDGYLYIAGAYTNGNNYMYSAQIKSDGSLGALNSKTHLPSIMNNGNSVTQSTLISYNGYLYLIGGDITVPSTGASSPTPVISFTQIGDNSSLSTWSTTQTQLPQAIQGATSINYNGYIYEMGGYNGTSELNNVYYFSLSPNEFALHTTSSNYTDTGSQVPTKVATPSDTNLSIGNGIFSGNVIADSGLSSANSAQLCVSSCSYGLSENQNNLYLMNQTSGSFIFRSFGTTQVGWSDVLAILDTGNVGIGTDSPSARLSIIGTQNQSENYFDITSYGSSTVGNIFKIDSSGDVTISGHIIFTGLIPTITAESAAGTSATASLSSGSTDSTGVITLTTGTASWTTGAQATITFANTYSQVPQVVLTPNNAITAAAFQNREVYVTETVSGFSINFGVADTASNSYSWNYLVVQ